MPNPRRSRRRYTHEAERILLNVALDQVAGCWNWQLRLQKEGYGQLGIYERGHGPRFWLAHRFSYITFVGPIPEGLELDHLCRNRACVNPEHLEPVTKKENARRGMRWEVRPTHCKRGHVFDETNTGIQSGGHRFCRTCARASARRSYERRMFRAAGMERAS